MKKITATAVATAMTMSLAVAPTANAASNTMKGDVCSLKLDEREDAELTPAEAWWELYATSSSYDAEITSSRWNDALGSSDTWEMAASNNLEALKACKESRDFNSAPVLGGEKAGFIIGTVLLALAAVGLLSLPFLAPQLKRYLPF